MKSVWVQFAILILSGVSALASQVHVHSTNSDIRLQNIPSESDPFWDRPASEENFQMFFRRITRGGRFPGITLTAPEVFEKQFLVDFRRSKWVGEQDKVIKKIIASGEDYWGHWRNETHVMEMLFPEKMDQDLFAASYESVRQTNSNCFKTCRDFGALYKAEWNDMSAAEREAFAIAYVTKWSGFGRNTAFEKLAGRFKLDAKSVLERTQIFIADTVEFEKLVRRMGWNGLIYFRGITGPSPENPKNRWIVLSSDLMKKMTTFTEPVSQAMEYVGILSHELTHVLQDFKAEEYGVDLRVKSAEGALLIEGTAEWISESTLAQISENNRQLWPLELFIREQAVEVVYREGNESQGNLFPYTVGLPFARSLCTLKPNFEELWPKIISVIDEKTPLKDFLATLN